MLLQFKKLKHFTDKWHIILSAQQIRYKQKQLIHFVGLLYYRFVLCSNFLGVKIKDTSVQHEKDDPNFYAQSEMLHNLRKMKNVETSQKIKILSTKTHNQITIKQSSCRTPLPWHPHSSSPTITPPSPPYHVSLPSSPISGRRMSQNSATRRHWIPPPPRPLPRPPRGAGPRWTGSPPWSWEGKWGWGGTRGWEGLDPGHGIVSLVRTHPWQSVPAGDAWGMKQKHFLIWSYKF